MSFLVKFLRVFQTTHQKVFLPLQRVYSRTFELQRSGRRIFIDCGANDLSVLKDFIESLDGFEFYAFEPQPALRDSINKLRTKYPDEKIQFYDKAVWKSDGTKELKLAKSWGKNFKGSSTILEDGTFTNNTNDSVIVQTVDFDKWIERNFSPEDYIIVKMDIEGAEYEVIKNMKTETIKMIDEFLIEFHKRGDEFYQIDSIKCVLKVAKHSILEFWR